MSSLRLALKQSLQESGPAGNKKPRSNRNRGDKSGSGKRKKRKGDSPRKRGRPKGSKQHRHQQGSTSPRRSRDSDDEEQQDEANRQDHYENSSDEAEFSAGEDDHSDDEDDEEEEGEEDEDNEEEEEDEEEEEGEEGEEGEEKKRQSNKSNSAGSRGQLVDGEEEEEEEEEASTRADEHRENHDSGDGNESDEEQRRRQRKFQKNLKHSAANMIQSQWKKKKKEGAGSNVPNQQETANQEKEEEEEQAATEPQEAKGRESMEAEQEKTEGDDHPEDAAGERKKKKKAKDKTSSGSEATRGKGKTAKTVPPPDPHILEWNRALPVKRARRNVAQGLRVKVRFATKVKREGKILRKKKWFGGRVSAVSKEGSKIRIKYDDGTAEISKFPDKDVVVCDAFNGQHQCDASKFQPPQNDTGSAAVDEEGAPTQPQGERKQSPQPPPLSEPSQPDEASHKQEDKPSESLPDTSTNVADEPAPQLPPPPDSSKPEPLEDATKPADKSERPAAPPIAESMEEETVRPPSPPVPEIGPPTSPPIPEIEMKPSAQDTAPPPPPPQPSRPGTPQASPKVSVPAPPEEPTSPGEIVLDKKEQILEVEKPIAPLLSEEKADNPQPAKEENSENPPKEDGSDRELTEKGMSTADSQKESKEQADQPKSKEHVDLSEMGEKNASVSIDEPEDAQPKAHSVEATSTGKQNAEEASEKGASVSTPDTKPENDAKRDAPPAKPVLTIRLPNPKKERRISGNEPKSPRIKISSKQIIHEGSEDSIAVPPVKSQQSTEMQKPTTKECGRLSPSGRKSPKPEGANRAMKRRRSEDEKELESAASGALKEPPSKRIHIQQSAILDDREERDNSTVRSKENKDAPMKPKSKRPSSRQADETQDHAASSKEDRVVDETEDGPVQIVARISTKRPSLFSDEEDEAATERLKGEREKEASMLQKPMPKLAKPVSISQSAEKHSSSQSLPHKKALASDEGNSSKPDEEKILLSSRNSAFDRKDGSGVKDGTKAKEDAEKLESSIAEPATRVPRPTTPTPMEKAASAAAAQATVVRSGRRAAQQANERIVSTKQDGEKEKEPSAEVKKRKRKERQDEDSESSNEDVNNWVQCFSCKKWRIIPNHITISSLPDRWYCHMNVDSKRNTCDAPEQTARTPVVKMKKKRRKKKRAAEVAETPSAVDHKTSNKVDQQHDVPKEKPRQRSPTPNEIKSEEKETSRSKEKEVCKAKEKEASKAKEKEAPKAKEKEASKSKEKEATKLKDKEKEATKRKEKEATKQKEKEPTKSKDKESAQSSAGSKSKPPRASPNSVSAGSAETAFAQQADIDPPPTKKSKHEKKSRRLPDEPLESIPEVAHDVKKRGRKSRKEQRERAEQDQNNGSFQGSVSSQQEQQDPDSVEWVQCDACSKWRKLPPHISAAELPEVWYCTNNTWNPLSASCDAPEDRADGQQDIGPSSPSPSSGKLSYRNLIFGSGRKVNRPVSERTRAAESIFATPSDDSESAHPTVMYAASSAFAPRGSRANIIEDDNHHLSVFDLMQHSNLFTELRGACQPVNSSNSDSIGFGRPFAPKYSFDAVPRNMRQDLKLLILESLGDTSLLGEEVAQECQSRRCENEEARSYCTKDIVITLLCELVREGKVQLVQAFGRDWTVKDWNPRYRLSINTPFENAAHQMPKSRCMKISKPWRKQTF